MNFYFYFYLFAYVIHLDQILYSLIWPLTHFWVNIRHIRGHIVQYFFITTSEKHNYHLLEMSHSKIPKLCSAVDMI